MVAQRLYAALRSLRPAVRPALEGVLPIGIPLLLLAHSALSKVLGATGGTPAVPLDDSYIHFQFARSFAEGQPLVYSPGTPPVPGATSLLFPLLLALPYALGFREHAIVWAAWLLGWVALGLLAHEARRLAEKLGGLIAGIGAAALVLAFGANTWFASSGMEVMPLAWLMLRAVRRAAEWCEGEFDGRERRGQAELVLLSVLLPLLRPEGAYASALVAGTLLLVPRGGRRWFGLLPLAAVASPLLVNYLLSGQLVSTTARAKWLPLSPYVGAADLWFHFWNYLKLLCGTLLNGELWTALFLPRGSAPFALAALAALPVIAFRPRLRARGVLLFLLALGSLIPATYECYLCNRVRYLWPFAPAWMVGAAALCELIGTALARFRAELKPAGTLVLGGFVGALAAQLPGSADDLAVSARAIFDQQVSLGLWAREKLPKAAAIGVNDTGAIAYFSGRRTFDIVGLTTAGEAEYWTAGAGSRFEHYERLGRSRLPTHFIVYPEWFALDPLLGRELTERFVPDATILGGQRMVAYEAEFRLLGSGHSPSGLGRGGRVIDRLDVADLESERSHHYELDDARKDDNLVMFAGDRLDGARRSRRWDRFRMELVPGGTLFVRASAELPTELELEFGEHRLSVEAPLDLAEDLAIAVPAGLSAGPTAIRLRCRDGRFSSLHYFSVAP
jgi:hypothetical protein